MSTTLEVRLSEEQLAALARRVAEHIASPEPDCWLSTREAADYLAMHKDTLRKLAAERRIPHSQDGPGCKLHFKRSELDAYREGDSPPTEVGHSSRAISPSGRMHDREHGPRLGRSREHGRT